MPEHEAPKSAKHERRNSLDILKRVLVTLNVETFFVIITFFVILADVMRHWHKG